jgi:hypothetical protein
MAMGVAVPLVYFGVQAAAAPFYPGYSFLARDASSLGSPASTAPWIFNGGMLALAVVTVGVAAAFVFAPARAGIGRGLAAVTGLALASAALGSLNAFLHPLPDPRHTEGLLAALGGGVVVLPILTSAIFWRTGARRAAVVNALAYLALIPMVTGLVQRVCMRAGLACSGYQWFLDNCQGLIQRVAAVVVFVPVGIVALMLRRRAQEGRGR